MDIATEVFLLCAFLVLQLRLARLRCQIADAFCTLRTAAGRKRAATLLRVGFISAATRRVQARAPDCLRKWHALTKVPKGNRYVRKLAVRDRWAIQRCWQCWAVRLSTVHGTAALNDTVLESSASERLASSASLSSHIRSIDCPLHCPFVSTDRVIEDVVACSSDAEGVPAVNGDGCRHSIDGCSNSWCKSSVDELARRVQDLAKGVMILRALNSLPPANHAALKKWASHTRQMVMRSDFGVEQSQHSWNDSTGDTVGVAIGLRE